MVAQKDPHSGLWVVNSLAKVTRSGSDFGKVLIAAKELEKLDLMVGWLESARYDDNTPVAGIAAVHEFGVPAKGIPPRPFIRPTVSQNQAQWMKLIESGAKAILAGNETAASVMEKIGLLSSSQIKTAISAVSTPALKDSTIKARKRGKADKKTTGALTKPLVDTGTLLTTVTYKVQP